LDVSTASGIPSINRTWSDSSSTEGDVALGEDGENLVLLTTSTLRRINKEAFGEDGNLALGDNAKGLSVTKDPAGRTLAYVMFEDKLCVYDATNATITPGGCYENVPPQQVNGDFAAAGWNAYLLGPGSVDVVNFADTPAKVRTIQLIPGQPGDFGTLDFMQFSPDDPDQAFVSAQLQHSFAGDSYATVYGLRAPNPRDARVTSNFSSPATQSAFIPFAVADRETAMGINNNNGNSFDLNVVRAGEERLAANHTIRDPGTFQTQWRLGCRGEGHNRYRCYANGDNLHELQIYCEDKPPPLSPLPPKDRTTLFAVLGAAAAVLCLPTFGGLFYHLFKKWRKRKAVDETGPLLVNASNDEISE
jgi:hypothetical protein